MHLQVLIFGVVLFPKAYTLECLRQIPGKKETSLVKCPSTRHQCGAMSVVSYGAGSRVDKTHLKACFLPHECVESSVNFGIPRIVIPIKCCSSDRCNVQDAPDPSALPKNGRKCYHCTGLKCTAHLECQGKEDFCFSNSVTNAGKTSVTKGCATKETCSKDGDAAVKANIMGDIKCCQGDFCNSACSSRGTLLLLLAAPLLSLLVFS